MRAASAPRRQWLSWRSAKEVGDGHARHFDRVLHSEEEASCARSSALSSVMFSPSRRISPSVMA